MIRVTTAEPAAQAVFLTSPDAPLWRDATGNFYRVASGLYQDCPADAWMPDPDGSDPAPQATPETTIRIAGMDGRAALHVMGLQP